VRCVPFSTCNANMGAVDVSKLSPINNFVLGATAGTIEVVILQPMLYCKNATQQGIPLTLNPAVLYRGVGVSVGNMVVLTGVQFPLTGAVGKMITGGVDRSLTKSEKIGAGFAGGAISGLVCAPMELIMIQQQRFGGGMLAAASRIVSEQGFLTLFRGLETSCGREGLFAAGYLGIGPVFADMLRSKYDMGASADFAGAAGAGMIAATCSHPLDTIKTCMQGDVERATYTNFIGTYHTLMAQGGVGAFFKGWGFRTTRMICAIWLIGKVRDVVGGTLFPHAIRQEGDANKK